MIKLRRTPRNYNHLYFAIAEGTTFIICVERTLTFMEVDEGKTGTEYFNLEVKLTGKAEFSENGKIRSVQVKPDLLFPLDCFLCMDQVASLIYMTDTELLVPEKTFELLDKDKLEL